MTESVVGGRMCFPFSSAMVRLIEEEVLAESPVMRNVKVTDSPGM